MVFCFGHLEKRRQYVFTLIFFVINIYCFFDDHDTWLLLLEYFLWFAPSRHRNVSKKLLQRLSSVAKCVCQMLGLMASNQVKWYFYSMPDESKANLRYRTFCIFCWYYIQKQYILNTLHTQKLINPLLINRHWKFWKPSLTKNAFQIWIGRQSCVYYQDLGLKIK